MVSIYSNVKMDTLSSTFLQTHAPITSSTVPPSLKLIQFKITSIRNNQKLEENTHPKIRIRTKNSTGKRSSIYPAQQKTQHLAIKKKQQPYLTIIFNFLDEFICKFLDHPLRPSIDPKHVLFGNFSPVDELPPTECTVVEGSLPPCLNGGSYIRNGPNPQFFPKGPYHLFDGDGMLHAITISQGEAKLCSRFVKTYKYELERETGWPIILNVFSAFNGFCASLARCTVALCRVIAGEYDPQRGIGNANTSLSLFSGKLFALAESDLPYAIKLNSEGDIITLGRHDCFGEPYMTMTAHPKVDTKTGEAFAFRHGIKPPFLSYFVINSEGVKQPEVPISSLKEASLVHDFVISENYAIFPDNQMVIRPKDIILKGKTPVGYDVRKVPRLGILPRYALDEGEMWWVEVPGFNMVHAVNAWEEDGGDTIVVVAANVLTMEHALERMDLCHSSIERVEINVKAKTVSRRPVSDRCLEFGVINPAYVGRKNRYIYAGIGEPLPKLSGVVKVDLSVPRADCTVASRVYKHGCYGGEPFFVAREPDNPAAEEDDGYLVTYVHNEDINESRFIVMDAKSATLEIIAVVKLPQRVPYGFHGIFVPERDLNKL